MQVDTSLVSQQERKKTEIYPIQSLILCLFWIMTVENSSRDFFVEPHSKRSPIFRVWPVVPPRPLFCVYFNYSLRFASKLQTPPRYTYHAQITPPSFL